VTLRPHDVAATLQGAKPLDFRGFGAFSGGSAGVFRSNLGTSPWEIHPDGEELLHVLEGWVDLEIVPDSGAADVVAVKAGSVLIVPRGAWHRHVVCQASVEIYVTCGRTSMSRAPDPRTANG
jgi:uncharacterized cupin superfamily protein